MEGQTGFQHGMKLLIFKTPTVSRRPRGMRAWPGNRTTQCYSAVGCVCVESFILYLTAGPS